MTLLVAALLLGIGSWKARDLKTGDLGKGIPELHDNSRYNRDNAAIVESFSIGVDVLSVIVQTKDVQGACTNFAIMDAIDRFELLHAQRPRRAVGDGAAGRGQGGQRRAGTRAASTGARCRATPRCSRSR